MLASDERRHFTLALAFPRKRLRFHFEIWYCRFMESEQHAILVIYRYRRCDVARGGHDGPDNAKTCTFKTLVIVPSYADVSL